MSELFITTEAVYNYCDVRVAYDNNITLTGYNMVQQKQFVIQVRGSKYAIARAKKVS